MSRPGRPDALPLRLGEYGLRRACGMMANSGRAKDEAAERDEREQDWCAELAAVHADPDFPSTLARASRTLRFAFGLFWYATRASTARNLSDDGRYAPSSGNPIGIAVLAMLAGAVGAVAGGVGGAFTGGPMGAFAGFWTGGVGGLTAGGALASARSYGSGRVAVRALLVLLAPLPSAVPAVPVGAAIGAATGFVGGLYGGAVGAAGTVLLAVVGMIMTNVQERRDARRAVHG
ncbi:hypothetical protein [Streptomyces sp. NPDC048340]|uniref:hypothetical protein n=1 Tax=Streptomyces sp. NPDC048340 TaxID=3365537 RepID=UPI003722F0A2